MFPGPGEKRVYHEDTSIIYYIVIWVLYLIPVVKELIFK